MKMNQRNYHFNPADFVINGPRGVYLFPIFLKPN